MIVVIADDLTGAAELAGIGLRYGLNVEVVLETSLRSKADLLIIATDTRSLKRKEALTKTRQLTRRIAKLKPDLVFKKIDSVLRGHVGEEIKIHLEELNLKRALVVPTNPALGRVIIDGHYYINGIPLHFTGFGTDPEFPLTTSSVSDILKTDGIEVLVKRNGPIMSYTGIIVGEVKTEADLRAWVNHKDNNTFLAGAAGFFTALLESLGLAPLDVPQQNVEFAHPVLIVSGTAFGDRCNYLKQLKQDGEPVSYMPDEILAHPANGESYHHWFEEIRAFLIEYGRAAIAIDPELTAGKHIDAIDLRGKTSLIAEKVFDNINIAELVIEGGSTAAEVLKVLSLTKMHPIAELAPGVIKMQADSHPGLSITLKPGSYPWPAALQFPILR